MEDDAAESLDPDLGFDAPTDAVTMLTEDHDEVRQLFQDYAALTSGRSNADDTLAVVDKLCHRLAVHASIEEDIFYPAARDALDDPGLINQSLADHEEMKELITALQGLQPDDDRYDAAVQALESVVEKHLDDEESELFPLTLDSSMDLIALGEEMNMRRQELEVELGDADGG